MGEFSMGYKEARRRYLERKSRTAEAKNDYQATQKAYEKAKALDLPTVDKFRNARDKALSVFRATRKWLPLARLRMNIREPLSPERTRISVNHSSRGGVKPRLIVLHITVSHNRPGLTDIDGILDFFDRPSTQASSHIVNDREGNDARCVRDQDKAWTQAAFNPQSLSIEQIEFEVKSRERWLTESRKQLDNTAAWVAHWSHEHDIPLDISTSRGVCQHRDLGAAGGGHIDCSPDYPMDYVLKRARQVRLAKYGH